MARVYSYLRFSDPKQAEGSSADRQAAYAKRWADERGLLLDESLSLRDEGLSAYHQKHVRQGALGAFLAAAEAGKIPIGSYLVVEGLDRLSRAEPIQAQAQLAQIISAGITVVTASDGKEYNRERLKANPMDLVYSLLVMIRAHEESDTKSKRVRAAIRRQCEGWIAGTWRGVIRNGRDPSWVKWNGQAFELIPDRAQAMREAIRYFLLGDGAEAIAGRVEVGISSASLYKMLKRPDLIGAKLIEVGGEQYRLDGYYPALISQADFDALQAQSSQRFRRRGKSEIPGILTGTRLLYCGYCGYAMVAQNTMGRNRKADGTVQDGHRRLLCCSHKIPGIECSSPSGGCSAAPVERALFEHCSDVINLSRLTAGDDQTDALHAEVIRIEGEIDSTSKQIDRVTEALLASDGAAPAAFVKRARELESARDALREKLVSAQVALTKAANTDKPAAAEAWRAVAQGAMALDYDARLQARQLVIDTFDRIVIFTEGVSPDDAGAGIIDMLLIAKSGRSQMLRFPRRLAVTPTAQPPAP